MTLSKIGGVIAGSVIKLSRLGRFMVGDLLTGPLPYLVVGGKE